MIRSLVTLHNSVVVTGFKDLREWLGMVPEEDDLEILSLFPFTTISNFGTTKALFISKSFGTIKNLNYFTIVLVGSQPLKKNNF